MTAKPLTSRILRASIAALATYAVVLQMFLTGLLAAQTAAAHPLDWSVICSGSITKSGGGQTPASDVHADCVLACAHVFAASADSPSGAGVEAWIQHRAAICRATIAGFVLPPPHSPRLSQGPPQIA